MAANKASPAMNRRLTAQLLRSEAALLFGLHVVVGLLSGLGAVLFHWTLEGTGQLLHGAYHAAAEAVLGQPGLVALPVAGALAAALLIWGFARYDRSHGTAAVIEAYALRGGRLPSRPLLVKVLAAAVFIGSGGSAGPEDPAVQVGAVAGSQIGQWLHLSDDRVRSLVAAGVAGAISAAFNAPIAGVFFALEIVVGEFSTALFAPVVLAAVAASTVSRALLGNQPAFAVPAYDLVNAPLELPLYALLGIPAAFAGVLFIRLFYWIEERLHQRESSLFVRAVGIGGVVGLVGLWLPDVLGVGYNVVGSVLNGTTQDTVHLAFLLGVKLVLTALCVAGMGVGGTFAPALYLGAMLGALYGQFAHALFPGNTAPPPAYALVGMGALLTAVVRAPITSVLLLFEVTNDYRIILPLMLCIAVTELFARRMFPESLYSERLARRGINLRFGRDLNIMELVKVSEAMNASPPTLLTSMTLRQAIEHFNDTQHQGLPVLAENGELAGMVTARDVSQALEKGHHDTELVTAVMSRDLFVAYPDQSLNDAMRLFALHDIGRMPVVDRDHPRKLLGLLRRHELARAYNLGMLKRAEIEQRVQQMKLRSQSEAEILEVPVEPGSGLAGRSVRNLQLPEDTLLASIRRAGQSFLPRAGTTIQPRDRLLFLVTRESAGRLRQMLLAHQPQSVDSEPETVRLKLTQGAAVAGQQVRNLHLPAGALVIAIRRRDHTLVPSGTTVLQPDDELTLIAEPEDLRQAVSILGRQGVSP